MSRGQCHPQPTGVICRQEVSSLPAFSSFLQDQLVLNNLLKVIPSQVPVAMFLVLRLQRTEILMEVSPKIEWMI